MENFLPLVNVAVALFLLLGMGLLIARLLIGPTLYDRILAVNAFGTKTVLFLCVFSLVIGRADGIDIAILYALMNFIATIAVLKFFRYKALSLSLENAHIDKDTVKTAFNTGTKTKRSAASKNKKTKPNKGTSS